MAVRRQSVKNSRPVKPGKIVHQTCRKCRLRTTYCVKGLFVVIKRSKFFYTSFKGTHWVHLCAHEWTQVTIGTKVAVFLI